jgi:hypothetical protein
MTKIFNVFIILLIITSSFSSPKDKLSDVTVNIKSFGISFKMPNKWIEMTENEKLKNMENIAFTEDQIDELLSTNNGNMRLKIYCKYDPKNYPGVIPTIQISIRSNPSNEFEEFKSIIEMGADQMSKLFDEFKFIKKVSEIKIDSIKSLYFTGDYSIKTNNNEKLKVRTFTFAIPKGKYFFQLNFNDTLENKNQQLFNSFLRSIKFK